MRKKASVASEFEGARLGDQRLNSRLKKVVQALEKQPGVGFPKALVTSADTEGFYRFLRNPKVDWGALLQPHREATAKRTMAFDEVLALHDTTSFPFTGEKGRKGLGKLRKSGHGFLGHFSLVVSSEHSREMLGVTSCIPIVRDRETSGQKRRRGVPYREAIAEGCESSRWFSGIENTTELLPRSKVIHVADREADDYALLCALVTGGYRFVIRANKNRELDPEKFSDDRLASFVRHCHCVCKRTVLLSAHKKKPGKRKGSKARPQRKAHLSFGSATITVLRPSNQDRALPRALELNVVHVVEPAPPPDMEPVEWTLLTTEPIDTRKQILRVVDFYRARWVIEEYFKAIKTGCAYLKRQLETRTTLLNALALLIPIAWNLLRMRWLSRCQPDALAKTIITERQAMILNHLPATTGMALDTVHDALFAIARLGGHLSHNGDPGWLTIARGYEDLLKTEAGYCLAQEMLTAEPPS